MSGRGMIQPSTVLPEVEFPMQGVCMQTNDVLAFVALWWVHKRGGICLNTE